MSFQNYDSFQNQQGQQDAGGAGPGAPPQQDAAMGGQPMGGQAMGGQLPDNSVGQFQGGNGGDPGSAGGQQPGGDAKTTLWYGSTSHLCLESSSGQSILSHLLSLVAATAGVAQLDTENNINILSGWANSNHGSTRTLFVACGTTWASK